MQPSNAIKKISLRDNFNTDSSGIRKLFQFYNQASTYKNIVLEVDMYNMGFFDANLSCLFYAILYKLNKDNGLTFELDLEYLRDNYDVLFRNGLFIQGDNLKDERESTIQLKTFDPNAGDDSEFIRYIKEEVLNHRGMPGFSESVKRGILQELTEISGNIALHSKTDDPFFVCGQYYPNKGYLIFSIVDLGVGFLPAIQQKTSGLVKDHAQAILWALEKGNTTKKGTPGGLGLYQLKKYCNDNNSLMQIVSGDKFWNSESVSGFTFSLGTKFVGSVINLLFSDKIS